MGRKGGGGARGGRGGHSPERFGFGALVGVLMFVPAGVLVYRGNLSIDDALLRFGLAWTAAVVGVGVVASALQGSPASRPRPAGARPAEPADPSPDEAPAS